MLSVGLSWSWKVPKDIQQDESQQIWHSNHGHTQACMCVCVAHVYKEICRSLSWSRLQSGHHSPVLFPNRSKCSVTDSLWLARSHTLAPSRPSKIEEFGMYQQGRVQESYLCLHVYVYLCSSVSISTSFYQNAPTLSVTIFAILRLPSARLAQSPQS